MLKTSSVEIIIQYETVRLKNKCWGKRLERFCLVGPNGLNKCYE